MAFEGDLKDLSLGDIFQTIQQNRQTGTLSISLDRQGRARVHFDEGKIALYSPDETPGPPFCDVLRRLEVLPEKELALAERKRGRKGLRTVLEERGLLKPADYKAAAERYLKDAVADLFLIARGRFQFQEGDAPRGAFDADLRLAGAEVEPQAVALEGLRRQDEWTRISRQIRSFDETFMPARPLDGEDDDSLSPEARRLYALLGECRSLDDCLADMPCGRFGTGAALVELIAQNLVEAATADHLGARAKEAEGKGDVAEAERLYRCALDVERNHLGLRENLAILLEREGRAEEAGRERTLLGLGRAGQRDLSGAIAEYKRAAELLPSDTASLERVLELERERRDQGQILAAGKRLAERYTALKLPGRARDLYRDLIREFPEDVDLKARLADTLGALGDKREAAAAWKNIGRIREREKDEQAALFAYQRALEADHEDREAAGRAELIRSGRLEARRKTARRLGRVAAAALIAGLFSLVVVRESLALLVLYGWAKASLDPIAADDGRALYAGFRSVARDYPFTIAALAAGGLAEKAITGELARVQTLSPLALRDDKTRKKAWRRIERLELAELSEPLAGEVRSARAWLEGQGPRPLSN
jgi:tetratricopeptide (TPR) repeat protein